MIKTKAVVTVGTMKMKKIRMAVMTMKQQKQLSFLAMQRANMELSFSAGYGSVSQNSLESGLEISSGTLDGVLEFMDPVME